MRIGYIVIATLLLTVATVNGQAELLSDGQKGVYFSGAFAMTKEALGLGGALGIASSVAQGGLSYTTMTTSDDLNSRVFGFDLAIFGPHHSPSQRVTGFIGGGIGFGKQDVRHVPIYEGDTQTFVSTHTVRSTSLSIGAFARPYREMEMLQVFLTGMMNSAGDKVGFFEDPGFAIGGGVQFVAPLRKGFLPVMLGVSRDLTAHVTSFQFRMSILVLQRENTAE